MNISKIQGIKIEGICACVPKQEIDNRIAGKGLFGDSIDDLIKSTGIIKRRICPNGVSGLDLCLKAAKGLFEESEADLNDIGGIVYVTFTPDNPMPNNATYCQHALGLEKNIPAFDINLACSGYPYGLWVSSMMAKSLNKKILLLDGDRQSHITSPHDKGTALLFSDAGSATLVAPSGILDEWLFAFETDGSKRESLIIKDGGAKSFFSGESLLYETYKDGSEKRGTDISMDGLEVFIYVVQNVKENLIKFLGFTAKKPKDINYLILHQANIYMMKQLAKKIGFSLDKLPLTADKYGNSSSATIPVTIASELRDAVKGGDLSLLLSGFGAGMSMGTALIKLDKNALLKMMEFE